MLEVPEISVVIPTRNRWRCLQTALVAALGQRDVDLEVIVVDDGSTDQTERELGNIRSARLRAIRHGKPRGVASARNTGITCARGDWLALLDDDDLWSPWKLRRQLDRLSVERADFSYASAVVVDERRRVAGVVAAPDPERLQVLLLRRNVLPAGCSNIVARTDLLRRLGGFDEHLSQLADWDLWIRLSSNGQAVACPEVLVAYVQHRESMLLTRGSDVDDEFKYLSRKHSQLGAERFDGVFFSRWVADGHRRGGRRRAAARVYLRAALRHRNLGSLARAAGVLLTTARLRSRGEPPSAEAPDWLELYD